uniref:Uncharacterized protein n=1 Tax=Nothobranchius rachovii TaxID=451742 RepID=A0A1A8SB41_9TELE
MFCHPITSCLSVLVTLVPLSALPLRSPPWVPHGPLQNTARWNHGPSTMSMDDNLTDVLLSSPFQPNFNGSSKCSQLCSGAESADGSLDAAYMMHYGCYNEICGSAHSKHLHGALSLSEGMKIEAVLAPIPSFPLGDTCIYDVTGQI